MSKTTFTVDFVIDEISKFNSKGTINGFIDPAYADGFQEGYDEAVRNIKDKFEKMRDLSNMGYEMEKKNESI